MNEEWIKCPFARQVNAVYERNGTFAPKFHMVNVAHRRSVNPTLFFTRFNYNNDVHDDLLIGSCLACVYRVMDARGKFGEHERKRKSCLEQL